MCIAGAAVVAVVAVAVAVVTDAIATVCTTKPNQIKTASRPTIQPIMHYHSHCRSVASPVRKLMIYLVHSICMETAINVPRIRCIRSIYANYIK